MSDSKKTGLFPTPKASPSGPDYARMNRKGSGGDDLATFIAKKEKEKELWPTPSVANATGGQRSRGGKRKDELLLQGMVREGKEPGYRREEMKEDQLKLSLPDSPAPTSPMPESRPEFRESIQDYLTKSCELLAIFEADKDSCPSSCWKTLQHSFLEKEGNGLDMFSGGFPKSLLIQVEAGSKATLFRLGTLMDYPATRLTAESASGLLPTPLAGDGQRGARKPDGKRGMALTDLGSESWPTPRAQEAKHAAATEWELQTDHQGTRDSLRVQVVKREQWPTPRASDGPKPPMGKGRTDSLPSAVKQWPTPTSRDFKDGPSPSVMGRTDKLPGAVYTEGEKLLPTPQASDNRDRGNLSNPSIQRRIKLGKQVNLSMCVSEKSGQLNPAWVCWLMGLPLDYLDLDGWQNPELEGLPMEYLIERKS